jgi:hypothetical protein
MGFDPITAGVAAKAGAFGGGPASPQDIMKNTANNTILQLPGQVAQYNQQVGSNANNIGTNFTTPTLQTDFTAKPGLDNFSKGLLSAGQQSIGDNLGATQGAIASKFRGPLAGVLQSQAATQARLNANPLLFSVASQQVGRQQNEATMGNNALLSQQSANNNATESANQALALKTGLQSLPIAANQNLIQSLQSGYKK